MVFRYVRFVPGERSRMKMPTQIEDGMLKECNYCHRFGWAWFEKDTLGGKGFRCTSRGQCAKRRETCSDCGYSVHSFKHKKCGVSK